VARWIEIVQYCIGVELLGGGEHNHLEVLGGLLKALKRMRSDVNPRLNTYTIWIDDFNRHLRLEWVLTAVYQCLIHVKNDRLPPFESWDARHIYSLRIYSLLTDWLHPLDVLKRLHCVN
jgi:hypothetical protein